MIHLVLLLLGPDFIRSRWRSLAGVGVFWAVAGLLLFLDALDGVLWFPLQWFGVLLLVESLATFAIAGTGAGAQKTLRYVKAALCLVIALVILARRHEGDFLLAMLFGLAFGCAGLLQLASALVVRFPAWKVSMASGVLNLCWAVFFIQPLPTHYKGTVPYCIGVGLMMSGWTMIALARRARRLRDAVFVDVSGSAPGSAMTVHVWTPAGSAKAPTLRRPLVDRYIAAVDAQGVISTGHAALEAPDVYISLYPAVEIDRSPEDFARLLRATAENDVPGVFQPDYPTESAAWCPSTERVVFRHFDPARLRAFWQGYRQKEIYNLTHRNCSSSVARALEAALEGAVAARNPGWWGFLELLFTPELWVAGQIRRRATTMAWTPGLTLDYARALRAIVSPSPLPWRVSFRLAVRHLRGWWRR